MPPRSKKDIAKTDVGTVVKKTTASNIKIEKPEIDGQNEKKVSYHQMLLICVQKEQARERMKKYRENAKAKMEMKNSESKPRVSEQILSATYSENDEDEKAEGSNEPVGAKANPEVHRQKLDVDQLKEIVQKEEARKNVIVPAADVTELIDTRKNPVPEG